MHALFSPGPPTPSLSFIDDPSSVLPQSSSLTYLNSQLIAHGFVPSPGLCLEGISAQDSERVVKTLFSLLGQRLKDMEQTEQLSTKLRTLTYDHERLQSMHRSAVDRADNAEREMNVFKSKLAASTKSLATAVSSHKATTADLIRTRTLLQGVRATHTAELKKRDKQIEKFVNRASKMSEGSGKYVNSKIVSGSCSTIGVDAGMGDLTETALEQAEERGRGLLNENLALKRLVGKAVNDVQSMSHELRTNEDEMMEPCTMVALFPLSASPAPTVASEKLSAVLALLKSRIDALYTQAALPPPRPMSTSESSSTQPETEVLKSQLLSLQSELDQARKTTSENLQSLLETYQSLPSTGQPHLPHLTTPSRPHHHADVSFDLLTAPAIDSEKTRLDAMRKELEEERLKIREAAIKVGNERAGMEKERLQWKEEKRRLEVKVMLGELPDTPVAPGGLLAPAERREKRAAEDDLLTTPEKKKNKVVKPAPAPPSPKPLRSPRASPLRRVGVPSPKRVKGVTHRSRSSPKRVAKSKSSSRAEKGKGKATDTYETEVGVCDAPLAAPVAGPSTTQPADTTSSGQKAGPPKKRKSLLPTEFVLPPPTPGTSVILGKGVEFGAPRTTPNVESVEMQSCQPSPPAPEIRITPEPESPTIPEPPPAEPSSKHLSPQVSPRKQGVAFPFSKRIVSVQKVHKYSPAKPSPLSRILMLANSPGSDDGDTSADSHVKERPQGIEEMFPSIDPVPTPPPTSTASKLSETELIPTAPKAFKAPPKSSGPRKVPVAAAAVKRGATGNASGAVGPVRTATARPRANPISAAIRKSPIKGGGRGGLPSQRTTTNVRPGNKVDSRENKGRTLVAPKMT